MRPNDHPDTRSASFLGVHGSLEQLVGLAQIQWRGEERTHEGAKLRKERVGMMDFKALSWKTHGQSIVI